MKKVILILFLHIPLFSQVVWFDPPTSSTYDYSVSGSIPIPFVWHHDNYNYIIECKAKLTYPDGHQSNWQLGETGGWHVTEAGIYGIEGQAHLHNWLTGWDGWWGINRFYFHCVDNEAPPPPTGLSLSSYFYPDHGYCPQVNWTLNDEQDVLENDDAYLIERRTRLAGGTWGNWSQIATESGQTNSFIDYGIFPVGSGDHEAGYRIRAKDVNNNVSNYTTDVTIGYGKGNSETSNDNFLTYKYILEQNYPNPFNPATSISYYIKENGLVTLKVYNMLGQEISELINEFQSEGYHSIEFNATDLPSGIYIYRINSREFTDVKKMQLIK